MKVSPRKFNYDLNYKQLDLRADPDLYRVGVGEQGVLLVEPYKAEILPSWRFRTPEEAERSVGKLEKLFRKYKRAKDFVGMDMTRKFLQMGYTRSRRYANHASGRKYDAAGEVLPFKNDPVKAASAEIFHAAWKKAEADPAYAAAKAAWKERLG
ncbi:MAG: DUF4385 domain-containing protein [Proteobacteria bacterium]|nr:MAG: DUF4385 domain-containing protein [Pseudomonadota bacterium]